MPPLGSRPACDSQSMLVRWMGILDANTGGFVHGGTVMKLCDEAAGLAGIKHARRRVVTAAVDRMTFRVRVEVGELLIVEACVNAAWRTSMEVGVRASAENPLTGERRHTSTAYFTMVAIGEDGQPAAVAPLLAQTPEEQRREREAQVRRRNRLAERDQLLAERD